MIAKAQERPVLLSVATMIVMLTAVLHGRSVVITVLLLVMTSSLLTSTLTLKEPLWTKPKGG